MKFLQTLTTLLLVTSLASAQTKFQINGTIQNLPSVKGVLTDGDTITLTFRDLNLNIPAVLKANTFTINGEIVEPAVATLQFKGSGVKVLIDNSKYHVSIVNKELDKGRYTYEGNVTTNSPFHNGWYTFVQSITKLYDQKALAVNEMEAATGTSSKSQAKTKINSVDSLINQSFKSFATKHPNNPAVAYVMGSAPDFSYKNYIDSYKQLSFKVKNGYFGKTLLNKLSLIKDLKDDQPSTAAMLKNSILPTVNVIDTIGKNTVINPAFFKPNKYTLIEFWASWCGPCRLINVDLRAKEQAYLSKGVHIIGFSLDQDAVAWKQAIVADQIKWPNYSDLKATHSPLAQFLNLTEIPANLVVNDKGEIIGRNVYGEDLEKILTSK